MSNIRVRPYTSKTKRAFSSKKGARPMTAMTGGNLSKRGKRSGTLQKNRNRWNDEKYQDELIQIAIKKIQNEKAYEVLIKMGEANEICQALNLDTTYRVFACADGSIKCQMFKNNQRKKSFELDQFERKYKELKKRYYEEQNLKKWEMLHDLAKSKNKNVMTAQKFTKEKREQRKYQSLASGPIDKAERQENLKKVLKETMNLTKTLKNQLSILQSKGINNRISKPKKKKTTNVRPSHHNTQSNLKSVTRFSESHLKKQLRGFN